MPPLGLTNGDVILLIVLTAIPLGAITFIIGAKHALDEIGKGQFAMDHDMPQSGPGAPPAPSAEHREAEIRQMLEAKAYRQAARGQVPVDVDAELERLLAEPAPSTDIRADAQLREEVRQLVVARNARRARQGKEPLDVEEEIERQLRDLENLGQ